MRYIKGLAKTLSHCCPRLRGEQVGLRAKNSTPKLLPTTYSNFKNFCCKMRFWIVLSVLLAFAAASPHTQEQDKILQKVVQYLNSARINDGQSHIYDIILCV